MAATVNTICSIINIASLMAMLYASRHIPPIIYRMSCLFLSLVIIPIEISIKPNAPMNFYMLMELYQNIVLMLGWVSSPSSKLIRIER
jgi:hypothetical protein